MIDDVLKQELLSRIPEVRKAHVLGVAGEAEKLARHWGADSRLAVTSAYAHDITKALPLDEQLKICERYDIVPDNVERTSVSLLHAITGEVLCRHEFLFCDEICSAVRWHTTGRPGMTLLDKVIFIADAIEPGRHYPEVDKLRKQAYSDLTLAVYTSLTTTILYTARKGRAIHIASVEARNSLIFEGKLPI